jgi:tetratricopeptide (TPR) repeat protein
LTSEDVGNSAAWDDERWIQTNIAGPGGRVYAVANGDQHVYIYTAAPPYRVEAVRPPSPVSSIRGRPPSWLLSPMHQVVPFSGREHEVRALTAWRDGPDPGLSVRLISGPGGQGKTRLATRLAELSARDGWAVATARHASEAAAVSAGDQHLAVHREGLLMVVDYAERWPMPDVLALLRQHRDAARTPLRVLLVARPAGWWHALDHQLGKIGITDTGHLPVGPLTPTVEERRAAFISARDRFAEALGLDEPARISPPPRLDDEAFGLVLTVHMAALAAVEALTRGDRAEDDPSALSAYLLGRERDHWTALHNDGRGTVGSRPPVLARATYTAVVTGALRYQAGAEALRCVDPDPGGSSIDQILADHAVCYPPAAPDTVLQPLYPDRLAEDFIALQTPGHAVSGYPADPWAASAPTRLLVPVDSASEQPVPYTRIAISVLVEAAHRWPHLVERQLIPLLRAHPQLALDAGGVPLARLVAIPTVAVDVLEAIERLLPKCPRADLGPGKAALIQRLTEHRLGTTTDLAARGRLYLQLAWALSQTGHYEQALAAADKAVGTFRNAMASRRPIDAMSDLAQSLVSQGSMRYRLERYEEVCAVLDEAAAIYRQLIADTPPKVLQAYATLGFSDWAASLERGLLTALRGLVMARTQLRNEEHNEEQMLAAAEELVTIHRTFATSNPAAKGERLAPALVDLSIALGHVGRHDEAVNAAEEAAAIFRRLATEDPPRFEDSYAGTLHALAVALWNQRRVGRAVSAAQEAASIYRRLTAAHPIAFERDLAGVLDSLGSWLSEEKRDDEALTVADEAAAVWRHLADLSPTAHGVDSARALTTLGARLWRLKRREPAIATVLEAADAHRRLQPHRPDQYERELAWSLTSIGGWLAQSGRFEEALPVLEDAVEIFRRPVAIPQKVLDAYTHLGFLDAGAGHAPGLARALAFLGVVYYGLGRHDPALAASREAVELERQLAERDPAGHEKRLAQALSNLPMMLFKLDHPTEGIAAGDEAIALFRRLARADPAETEASLAAALYEHGRRLSVMGQHAQALAAIAEAVEIRRRLAAQNPAIYERSLAEALWGYANVHLAGQQNLDQARVAAQESVTIFERLAKTQPNSDNRGLLNARRTMSQIIDLLGRTAD